MRLDPSSAVLSFEIKVSSLVLGNTTDTRTCTVFLKLMLEIYNLYSKVLTHLCLSPIEKKEDFSRYLRLGNWM